MGTPEPKNLATPELVALLTCKDDFNPALQEMTRRLQAVKTLLCQANEELQEISRLFIDNLERLMAIKGIEKEAKTPIPESL